jgi:hypothetical protein
MFELATLTIASLAAGFVNAIAGGGGLIAVPVLFSVFPAAPPATLFGTSKAAMVWDGPFQLDGKIDAAAVALDWAARLTAVTERAEALVK